MNIDYMFVSFIVFIIMGSFVIPKVANDKEGSTTRALLYLVATFGLVFEILLDDVLGIENHFWLFMLVFAVGLMDCLVLWIIRRMKNRKKMIGYSFNDHPLAYLGKKYATGVGLKSIMEWVKIP